MFASDEHDRRRHSGHVSSQKVWSLDLRAVHVFVTIAAERGFRRAAQRLQISPASASQAVSKLERHLGVRLFDRSRGGVRLTFDGQALLPPATAVLNAADTVELVARAQQTRSPLRVGTLLGLHADLIDRAAPPGEGGETPPLRLTSTGWDDPTCGLRHAAVDVAILAGPTDHDTRFVRRHADCERLVAMVAATSPLARRATLTLADLDACGWARIATTDDRWRSYWRLDDLRGGSPREHSDPHETPASLVFAIRRGRGVWTTLASFGDRFLFDGLALVPVADAEPVAVDVAWRRDLATTSIERFAQQIVADAAARLGQ